MPLVRVEVRNEYGLGMPELYTETNREDPKALLDGVAVAGLVGILRQLGDLAEFAAEVFHGLQEQVLITSSRSHKLVERVYNIEAALPPLEKAILAQRSHLHFAYTAGSNWHTRLKTEQNHFLYSDLPRCIMDSYEDCRDPPRLHKLDKFDIGGPGSCFKRYSDPTYFKRASVGSYEAHLQSVPREKKARRSRKKSSSSRFRKVAHDAPLFTHGGSMDFASPNVNGKTSLSQDVSTIDVAAKSGKGPEMETRPSFDSRTGSGYIECIFRPSYSIQSEKNESKELSSDSKVQYNAYLDSSFLHENSGVQDDKIRDIGEHSGPRSSYVTWDENLEIMEMGQQNGTAEPTSDKLESEQKEDLDSQVVDQIKFDFHGERLPMSAIDGEKPDEIESETDYYMDALNTIESESETDVDCHTKKELQHHSCVNSNDVEEKDKAGHSEDNAINLESHVPEYTSLSKDVSCPSPKSISPESHMEAYSFSNNETSEDKTNSDQLENNDMVISPQMADISSNSSTSLDLSKSEKGEMLGRDMETVSDNGLPSIFSESNPQRLASELTLSTVKSTKPPLSISGAETILTHPVMFWTNGGLLGLEPSKPPDFGLANAIGPDSVAESKDDVVQHSSHRSPIEDDGHVAKTDMTVNASKSEPASNFPGSNSFSDAYEHNSNASGTRIPATDGPVAKDITTKAGKQNGVSSSRIFEFSNRLLVNGFRRQISLVGDEKLASSVRSDVPEKMHKGYDTVTGKTFREQFGNGSSLVSPSSSPPLEHIRISFQPIDGFETYKLKLKFPDGSSCQESSGDMFPSFQLVPEPAILRHDSCSDSDDDTFCRSSPYASDDCHSHHSESNSEQWESDDSPRSKDCELEEAFARISSEESVSSSLVNGSRFQKGFHDPGNRGIQNPFAEDGVEPSYSGRTLDIPNFDSLSSSLNQVTSNSNGKDLVESCFTKEPTPPPPPLPPLEWRGIKPHPDITIEKEEALSEALTYTLDVKFPEPAVLHQPKPAPIKQDSFVETVDHAPKSKPHWQKPTMQNDANCTIDGNVDDKDDFLQQIRTKSFNLRRTTTARPTFTPGGPSNIKVTAILEKASAIRQAVGSDDGEDDNWSDA